MPLEDVIKIQVVLSWTENMESKLLSKKYISDQVIFAFMVDISRMLQVWNIQAFSRWLLGSNIPAYESTDICKDLKSLASKAVIYSVTALHLSSLVETSEERHRVRYTEMELPAYAEVLGRVIRLYDFLCENGMQVASKKESCWIVQKALVLGLQTLVPPLRGRPYWDLKVFDDEKSSMSYHCPCFFIFMTQTDCLIKSNDGYTLVVRQHKTSKSSGFLKIPLMKPISGLLSIWLDEHRPKIIEKLQKEHDFVFISPASGMPFGCSTFSRYFTHQAQECLGLSLNLQKARRIFIRGMMPQAAFLPPPFPRLLDGKSGRCRLGGACWLTGHQRYHVAGALLLGRKEGCLISKGVLLPSLFPAYTIPQVGDHIKRRAREVRQASRHYTVHKNSLRRSCAL